MFWFLSMVICICISIALTEVGIEIGFWGGIAFGATLGTIGAFMDKMVKRNR